MSRYRWCSFCTHAFGEAELAEDEYGLPTCPYCGAPGMYLRAWNAVRSLSPGLPDQPEVGERYRLVDATPDTQLPAGMADAGEGERTGHLATP